MTDEMEGTEQISFELIAASGQARSCAFNAIEAAKEGNFAKADELMAEAEKSALAAHEHQNQLLFREASGDHVELDVLLVHAQDHLMTSMLAREFAAEIIALRRELATT